MQPYDALAEQDLHRVAQQQLDVFGELLGAQRGEHFGVERAAAIEQQRLKLGA